MGGCCTKQASFEGGMAMSSREVEVYDTEVHHHHYHHHHHHGHQVDQEQDDVRRGDFGASVRMGGSSTFVSMATQQGRKGVNQDAMTVWEDYIGEKDVFFCGVFDGHGPYGHKVSRRVRDNLPSKIANIYKTRLHDEEEHYRREGGGGGGEEEGEASGQYYVDSSVFNSWKASFVRAFKEMDKDLTYDPIIDGYCSGATAVTVVKQGDHLIIGNLGDSRAVLCSRGDKGQVMPVQLTVDLKPSVRREAERIAKCKGRVFSLDQEPDVLRVWQADEDSPGLAMTRAFGDFCLKDYGLISIPQIFYRRLTERDEFVVLASDGVWDVLTNLEVVKIVSSARRRSQAAKLLVSYASRAWRSRFPNSRVDDIAVVVLYLKHPPSTGSISDLSHITPDSLSHLNSSISDGDNGGFEFLDNTTKIRDDEPEDFSVLEGAGGEDGVYLEEGGGDAMPLTVRARRRKRGNSSDHH